jgi:hypothetical protein
LIQWLSAPPLLSLFFFSSLSISLPALSISFLLPVSVLIAERWHFVWLAIRCAWFEYRLFWVLIFPEECRDTNLNIDHDRFPYIPPDTLNAFTLLHFIARYNVCSWHRAENYVRIKHIYNFIFFNFRSSIYLSFILFVFPPFFFSVAYLSSLFLFLLYESLLVKLLCHCFQVDCI